MGRDGRECIRGLVGGRKRLRDLSLILGRSRRRWREYLSILYLSLHFRLDLELPLGHGLDPGFGFGLEDLARWLLMR